MKRYLFAPGPTPVPPEVLAATARPLIHHRTPEFGSILAEVREGLRYLFQTDQDVLILAASGTGAMEAAVTNTLSPGEEVIVVNGGKFGERWTKICQAFGVEVAEIAVEWGKAVRGEEVRQALDAHPRAKALLLQASETSTTVLHPVEEIAALVRDRDVLLVVDGVTAVGAVNIPMDAWRIDVLVAGSQKAFMLPPGLAFIALSPKAWGRVEEARLPRFYFDLNKERQEQTHNTTAFTPAISLVIGLHRVLAEIRAEGLPRLFSRHERLARAAREAAKSLGLSLLAPDSPSPAATGIWLPSGIDGRQFLTFLREKMGITFAGGQDRLRGKIVRIAHIGYVDSFDVLMAIAALEMALKQFGYPVELGKGVSAAERVVMEEWSGGKENGK